MATHPRQPSSSKRTGSLEREILKKRQPSSPKSLRYKFIVGAIQMLARVSTASAYTSQRLSVRLALQLVHLAPPMARGACRWQELVAIKRVRSLKFGSLQTTISCDGNHNERVYANCSQIKSRHQLCANRGGLAVSGSARPLLKGQHQKCFAYGFGSFSARLAASLVNR